MLSTVRLGAHFVLGHPPGYEPNAGIVTEALALAPSSGGSVEITTDPMKAVARAHAVYTDVWASMGQEAEAEERARTFQPYQVTEQLMSAARRDSVFMHCLPVKRGQETVDAIVESRQSVVFDQAENRLHAQKALLLMMLS
jgi:ornithine carbamoyltransferase